MPSSWVEGGLAQRCFSGTKPPGSPLGAVTPAWPLSRCQALRPELVIAGAEQAPLPLIPHHHWPVSVPSSTPLRLPLPAAPTRSSLGCPSSAHALSHQVPRSFPPARPLPTPSGSRACAHHAEPIMQSRPHGQASTLQGHQPKLGWLWPPRVTAGTLMSPHSDRQESRNYSCPSYGIHSLLPFLLLSTTSPDSASHAFSRGCPALFPSPPAYPGSLCIGVLPSEPHSCSRPSKVPPKRLQTWAPFVHPPPCSLTPIIHGDASGVAEIQVLPRTSTSNAGPAAPSAGHCSCMWHRRGAGDFIPFGAEPGIELNPPSCSNSSLTSLMTSARGAAAPESKVLPAGAQHLS